MGVCVLVAFSNALPLAAQEARWNELNAQALQLYKQGKYTEAIPIEQEALRVAEATFGAEHVTVGASAYLLATLYDKQGLYPEAEPFYKRAITVYEKSLGPDHLNVATALNDLGKLYKDQGRYAEAEPHYKRALDIRERTFGSDHPTVAAALNNLAALYDDQGRYNLGKLYMDEGRYAEAEPLCRLAAESCLWVAQKVANACFKIAAFKASRVVTPANQLALSSQLTCQ